MDAFFERALRRSKIHLLLLAALTVGLSHFAVRVDFDFTLERLFAPEGGLFTPPTRSTEALDTYRAFTARHGKNDLMLYAAFRVDDVFSPDTREKLRALAARLRAIDGVETVITIDDAISAARTLGFSDEEIRSEMTSSPIFRGTIVDGRGEVSVIIAQLSPQCVNQKEREPVLAAVREVLQRDGDALRTRFYLAGIPTIEHEYIRLTQRDLLKFMPISMGVFLLLLALYFRNVVGTFLPLATVLVGVIWMLGGMALAGRPVSVLTTIVPNLIIVIGISDSVHMLSRYQEDLARRPDRRSAVAHMMTRMTWACFLTSFTTAVGFASLILTNVAVVQEFGLVSAIGIMLAYVLTIQVVPVVLDNVPPLRGRFADEFAQLISTRSMRAVARWVHRRPGLIVAATAAILTGAAFGIPRIEENSSWLQDIDSQNEVYVAHDYIEHSLSSIFTVELSLAGDFRRLETIEALDAYETRLRGEPRVGSVVGWADVVKEAMRADPFVRERRLPRTQAELDRIHGVLKATLGKTGITRALMSEDFAYSRVTIRASERLEARGLEEVVAYAESVRDPAAPFTVTPTGKSWLAKKSLDGVIHSMIATVGVAALVISLVMAFTFGSIRTGLIAMIPNFLPMAVTAGLMGYLDIDLNFSTITVFSVSLGLAVDNTIHFLSRYRIEIHREPDHVKAIYRTLEGVGRPMVFSTILLVLGFSAILTSNFKFTFYFGLLGGVTVFTALLGDLFVLPVLLIWFRPTVRTPREFFARFRR
ncbi:MAG: hypothetical protein A3F84_02285 [Candidatus Handelsmanbacteria bacterium RIFCSPLOWO2_12_FULL_64_10]|uniref:SSD domain-containing protein n=1 Tax=Handelsmanbacteria sp. (strain RIFCSPLOWO2_12_FULL_64_10) TaxID=1817868 RepID=A0A1F6CLY1_HANXR|nr:MAG: hypothetical protein A3F84_02285 [Candidatus Handelsmanbacteria bacterium RIFCSPLOWO2_12_FULL_64_10]